MAAEAGDVQVRLLDVRRHAGGRPAALHIDNDERHFRHHSPAERLSLERNARTARAGHGDAPGVARADGHRDRRDLVFALDEHAAVLGQFAAEQFHDVRPRRDRVARAEAHAGGDQAIGQRLVAVHDDLMAVTLGAVGKLKGLDQPGEIVGVTGVEGGQRVLRDALVLAGEALGDELLKLRQVQVEHAGDQAERVKVLALVLRRAADGLNCQTGDRYADVVVVGGLVGADFDVVRIVQHDAALLERAEMVLIRLLIKRQEHIGVIARAQHLAGADAHLED